MFRVCLRAVNQISGLEWDLYFGDHEVSKMMSQKSDLEMIFSAEQQMFSLWHL